MIKFNKDTFNKLLMYFIRGLLLAVPLALTVYILSLALNRVDRLIGLKIPGLGMIIIIVSITLFGYLGSTLLVKSLLDWMESFITKVPLIRVVYSSLKEFVAAFVGNKKKFNRPVVVIINKAASIYRLGFITQEALDMLSLPGSIAVYFPYSYGVSGDLLIVPKETARPLDIPNMEVMKFILSGGVTDLPPLEKKEDALLDELNPT